MLHRTLRGYLDVRGQDLAAGLAYASLISFVPLVAAVTVLTSTLFGDAGTGFYRLIRVLTPGVSRELLSDLQAAALAARAISGWASFLFVVSSLRMYFLLEGSVNALWGSTTRRPPMRRLGAALVVVLLGPVAFGALTSLFIGYGVSLTEFRFSGLVLSAALLTLLYRIVPAAKVRWGPAAAAGVLVGSGLALLKYAFTKGVAALATISRVYGSISAIVILVFALGFVWTILLLGVSLAHALQFRVELLAHDQPEREARRASPLDEAVRMLLALACLWRKTRGQGQAQGQGLTLKELSDEVRRPEDDTEGRLKRLAGAGLIAADASGVYRLTRPPEEISLYTIARALGEYVPRALPAGDDPTDETLRRVFRRADREVRAVLQGTSLRDLERRQAAKASTASRGGPGRTTDGGGSGISRSGVTRLTSPGSSR